MGVLTYKLGRWKKIQKIGIGIIVFGGSAIVLILPSIQSIDEIGLGTKVAIIINICIFFVGIFLLLIAQVNLRIINRDINRSGDP